MQICVSKQVLQIVMMDVQPYYAVLRIIVQMYSYELLRREHMIPSIINKNL